MARHSPTAMAALAALALTACGSVADKSGGTTGSISGDITVFAAASLTEAYGQLAQDFRLQHPQARVTSSFAGSSALVTQILQGAAADVFASADEANMQKLVDAGQVEGTPAIFARNRLEIAVRPGNPKGISSLADLARPDVVLVLCAPQVPCGSYAAQALQKAGVKASPRSQEQDVRQVVTKVSLGEADAGIVYTTDVKLGGTRVQGVDIPDAHNVVAKYPIAQVRGARNPATAKAFIGSVLGDRGQAVLERFGFARP